MPKEDDLKDIVDHLATFGWNEKKAKEFAEDKIVYATMQIPIQNSVEILRMLCTEGVPATPIAVRFMIPASRFEMFKQVAEMAAAKAGGFFLTAEGKAGILPPDPKKVN